ncbi:MAG: ATP-binding cassette domain-containing protein [Deferribacteraceae bacterium]|jgi:energy-coupling factor transporter ATP-binding protein EcfA2|nr:ATP-binding cassette domain-containing protein [Deferribacteraceae bacterium]
MKYRLTASGLAINGFSIRDFSVEFERILLIKGRIGCGKTLLLKALAGVYRAAGRLELSQNEKAVMEGYFVHSQPEFNFVASTAADELLFAGLDPRSFIGFPDKPIKHLSGGELKKLSVLIALKSRYEVILLDEPLDMLDDEEQALLIDCILSAAETKAIIIASHSEILDNICDAAVYLEESPFSPFIPRIIPERLLPAEEVISAPQISLSLKVGEIGVLFGKNGAGKTRILRRLAGLKSWGEELNCTLKAEGLGVCLQFIENMIWQESVYELIEDIAGSAYIEQVLKKLGWTEEKREENPLFLSDGEKRALFLTANLISKKTLLLDEPFANLDRHTAEQIKGAIYDAALDGATILYTANKEAELFLSGSPAEKIFKVCRVST